MKLLDNSHKHLMSVLPDLIFKNLNKYSTDFKFIGGGSYGRVYKVTLSDGELIAVKGYKLREMQSEEAQQLTLLSQNTSVTMPDVLFTYEDDTTAILAMSYIEGENVLNPLFLLKNKKQKHKFCNEVISGMSEWHSVTNNKFGSLTNPVYDNWYEYYSAEKQEPWLKAFKDLANNGKLSKNKLNILIEATKLFNELPQENTKAVLIHGDLNIMNIMAEPRTLGLIAFIDPCGCMWADKEYDLYQFRNMWGDAFGLYDAYKRKFKSSEYTDFRVAYYGAMHETSMRLKGGHIVPLWEDLNFSRLKKEMKKLKNTR